MSIEDNIINLIKQKCMANRNGLIAGIGDDAAVFECNEHQIVITTDMLIEDIHFKLDLSEPYLLGWKVAAVNISDIAAMAAKPTFSVVSIGLQKPDQEFVAELYRGITDANAEYGSVVIGGDTVKSPIGLVINVTQLGELNKLGAAYRNSAKPDYVILVTNTLGDSLAGLNLLMEKGLEEARNESQYLVLKQLKPYPRIKEAQTIKTIAKANIAMMDLSDGLSTDLKRLCEASSLGAVIYENRLPVSDELIKYAKKRNLSAYEKAAKGGEDYELLFCCSKEDAEQIIKSGLKATIIGEMRTEQGIDFIRLNGTTEPMPSSWEHF